MFWTIVGAILFVFVGIPLIIQLLIFMFYGGAYALMLPFVGLGKAVERLPERHRGKAWNVALFGIMMAILFVTIYIHEEY